MASPIQICSVVRSTPSREDGPGSHRIELHDEALKTLLAPALDKPLVVIACVGAMRGGKSTFLSWLVRCCENPDDPTQAGHEFRAAWGKTPCTSGIWAKCVVRENDAVLFLDTQGLYDMTLDVQTTSNLFSLTCILANYLVFNVGSILSEDIVSQTAQFGVVARHARPLAENEERILQFLVRDWANTEVDPTSAETDLLQMWTDAAKEYTRESLLTPRSVLEVEQNRKALHECFTEVSIALLPHPGLQITRPDFDESQLFEKADPVFRILLRAFCTEILAKASAVRTKSTGREVYLQLLEGCKALEQDEITVESLFVATARANGAFALDQARKAFVGTFAFQLENFEPGTREALHRFKAIARFGPKSVLDEYLEELVAFMEESLDRVRALEKRRRRQRTLVKRTAFVVVTGAVLAPWWIPAVVSFGLNLGIRASSSVVLAVVSPTTAAVIAVSTAFMLVTGMRMRKEEAKVD